jgi:hypothetical protein
MCVLVPKHRSNEHKKRTSMNERTVEKEKKEKARSADKSKSFLFVDVLQHHFVLCGLAKAIRSDMTHGCKGRKEGRKVSFVHVA